MTRAQTRCESALILDSTSGPQCTGGVRDTGLVSWSGQGPSYQGSIFSDPDCNAG